MRARQERRSRPAALPPRRGRLDGRLIRRATLTCHRLACAGQRRVRDEVSYGPKFEMWCQNVSAWCFRPRFVGAQSKEPRPSAATMRRRTAKPADPVPTAEHTSDKRGAQAASFARCIIVESYSMGKVAARGRAVEPDKAGANSEE